MQSFPEAQQRTPWEKLQCHGKEVWSDRWIPQFQATQIGRAPYVIQSNGRSPYEEEEPFETKSHQEFSISAPLLRFSQMPINLTPVNVPEPLNPEGQWNYGDNNLMIGDLGCIYITMDDDGRLHIGESSY